MRLTLLHNPSAGSGRHSADELRMAFWAAGFDVTYQAADEPDFARALERATGLVVAAGGDGTVADAAKCLLGRHVPLAVLPLGTANNIARSLAVHGDVRDLIAGLDPDRVAGGARRRLHVGTARGPWGTARFVESAGVGLIAELLREPEGEERELEGTDAVRAGRRRLRRVLDRARPRFLTVEADGEDLSGHYTMVEVVSTRYVGPRVALAPAGRAADGSLHLVLAGERERRAVGEYLAHDPAVGDETSGDADAGAPVPTREARRVRVGWPPDLGHLDDEPWPRGAQGARPASADDDVPVVEIAIADPPIEVVVPAGIGARSSRRNR